MPDCERPVWTSIMYPFCERHAIAITKEVLITGGLPGLVRAGERTPRRPSRLGKPHILNHSGVVYFADCENLIKIGFSTNVRQRMKQIGGRLIVATPGTKDEERALHHRFGEYWVRGEYFSRGPKLMAYVDTLVDAA
jgi:hypothetical protein